MTANHARKNLIRQRMAETGESYTEAARFLAAGSSSFVAEAPRGYGSCVFCGSTDNPVDIEHVIPRWARRAFAIPGGLTLYAREVGAGDNRAPVDRLQHLNIVLKDALCRPCNTEWLGGIERRAARILKPMAVDAQPAILGADAQALVAFWAVKTGLLLELALRQMYPGQRAVGGYEATAQELACLRKENEPPPRSMVWLGCWDCQKEVAVRYEPSSAPLPTADGSELAGHLTTFTLGFVAFQIFTVDFIAAEQHGAPEWNPMGPPATIREALPRLWPRQLTVADVTWPPPAFAHDDWRRMVTWDEKLRPNSQGG